MKGGNILTAEQMFDEYIAKFCAKHEIPREVAEQNAIVKEYRSWVIKECKDDNRREEAVHETIQTCGC